MGTASAVISSGPAKPMDMALARGTWPMARTNMKLPAQANTPRVAWAQGLRIRRPVQRRRGVDRATIRTSTVRLRRQMS